MMNMENAKDQTYGVEIEMNNITRKEAARLAAEYFGTSKERLSALFLMSVKPGFM